MNLLDWTHRVTSTAHRPFFSIHSCVAFFFHESCIKTDVYIHTSVPLSIQNNNTENKQEGKWNKTKHLSRAYSVFSIDFISVYLYCCSSLQLLNISSFFCSAFWAKYNFETWRMYRTHTRLAVQSCCFSDLSVCVYYYDIFQEHRIVTKVGKFSSVR